MRLFYNKEYIFKLTRKRAGEKKLGEFIQTINSPHTKKSLKKNSAKFVLIEVSEDTGVRANYGRGDTNIIAHASG